MSEQENTLRFIVVMGVSGSGKSTIAAKLADCLGWIYEDADSFHPRANVEKMLAGQPLADEDRWPWLAAIAAWIADARVQHKRAVIACSALRRSYRRVLFTRSSDMRLVYLKGEADVIARRLALRKDHYMPSSLL